MADPTFDQRYQAYLKARSSQAQAAQADAERMGLYLANTYPEAFQQAELARANEQAARYSMNQQVGAMGPLDRFTTAAGIQANRMIQGAADLIGMGDGNQRANEMAQYDMANQALYDQAPVTAFAGNAVGGALAAAPLAALTPEIAGAGMGALAARGLVGATAGALEGAIEYPAMGESRLGNAAFGAGAGLGAEALGTAIKRFMDSRSVGVLDTRTGTQNIETALAEQGLRFEQLRPETQNYLKELRNDVDIEDAIQGALETEYGFKLTRGEASGDFTQLSNEAGAARMSGKAADDLRAFKVEQNRGIIAGADSLAEAAGGSASTAELAGRVVKESLERVRQGDENTYRALYDDLRGTAVSSGADLPIPGGRLESTFRQLVADHGSEYEGLLNDIGRRLADYGVLDAAKFGSSPLLDSAEIGRKPLTISNQPELVKYFNSLYSEDPVRQRIVARLKSAAEQSTGETIDGLLEMDPQTLKLMGLDPEGAQEYIRQARMAREAFKDYNGLWENSDVLQQLVDTKPGSTTPVVDPSAAAKRIMSSPENVRRVVGLLQERGAMDAVADLRTFVLKDIFDQAVNPNNIDAAGEAVFSGSKLSSILKKQAPVLEALLTPDQLAQLRAFEAQVGKATKRPAGVVNQSNTAYKIMDFFFNVLGLGRVPLLSIVPEVAGRSTVRGALDSTPRQAPGANVLEDVLRLGDKHKNLNMILRQAFQAGEPLNEEEQRPVGVLAQ